MAPESTHTDQGRVLAAILLHLREQMSTGWGPEVPAGHRAAARIAYFVHNEAIAHLEGRLFDESALARVLATASEAIGDPLLLHLECSLDEPDHTIHQFAAHATAVCALVEDPARDARVLLQRLASLQAAALDLPVRHPSSMERPEADAIDPKAIHRTNAPFGDPTAPLLETILRGVSDHLREGLDHYARRRFDDAAWSWRRQHLTQWGHLVVDAQAALLRALA